jgi:hypothetical protein
MIRVLIYPNPALRRYHQHLWSKNFYDDQRAALSTTLIEAHV